MAGQIKVDVVQKGNEYFLAVQDGTKQAKVPIPGCKSMEEAKEVQAGLLKEIEANTVAQGTPDENTGKKLDATA